MLIPGGQPGGRLGAGGIDWCIMKHGLLSFSFAMDDMVRVLDST